MNKPLLTVTLLLSFLLSGEAVACSCMSKGSFVEYAKKSEGVIRAKIVAYGDKLSHGKTLYDSMTVEVVSVVKGNIRFESIVLLGDPGHLCRDYVDSSRFKIGGEFLIALHGDEQAQPFGGCGEAWLHIDGELARGHKWVGDEYRYYARPLQDLLETIGQP